MTVLVSTRAREDLEYIYALIFARQGAEAADRFLDITKETIHFLAKHPEAGPHPNWTFRHKQIRFWVISRTNFVIYYFVANENISIERVLDGRRDVKRIIDLHQENPGSEAD